MYTTIHVYIYWKILKMQQLIQCQFLPEDQIHMYVQSVTLSDNKIDKSDQLACIRYKNLKVLA